MIDSGILAGVTHADADRHLYHRVMSLQVGLPLTVLDRSTMVRLAEVCAPLTGAHAESFTKFCENAADRLESALSIGKVITAEQLVPVSHFAHPLYRHMKDHLCVRLYECLHLLQQVDRLQGEDVIREHFILEESNFETFVFRSGDDVVMVGPTFTQDHIGDGIARPHYALMQRELEKFNGSVRQFWAGAPGAEGMDRAIYTTDFLRNVSFQRDRSLGSMILGRIRTVKRALSRYCDVEALCLGLRTSPRAMVKAVAAIEAAHTSGKPGIFLTKGFDGSSPTTVPIIVAPGGMRIVDKEVTPDPSFEEAYARCMEDAFQHWSSFIGESLGRLRTWLLAEPFGGEGNRLPERAPDFGRRLARFLGATFDAYEAIVYTIVYRCGVAQLSSVGAFSADPRGDERLQAMDRHMKSIAGTAHERDSISFRCLRENAVQYCQSYDYGSRTAVPRGQCIA